MRKVAIRGSKGRIAAGLSLCGVEGMRSTVDVVSALFRGDRTRVSLALAAAERTPACASKPSPNIVTTESVESQSPALTIYWLLLHFCSSVYVATLTIKTDLFVRALSFSQQ